MSVTIIGPLMAGGIKLPFYSSLSDAVSSLSAGGDADKRTSLEELLDIQEPDLQLVKVEDDSMQGVDIVGGDLVVVDRRRYAEHGDIVVALLNAEPVCKRLYMKGPDVILKSENSDFLPRPVLESDDLVIWGVVKQSIRSHDKA